MDIQLSGKGVGADVRDVCLANGVTDDDVATLKSAWHEHLVLRFRRQTLSDEQMIGFTRKLGEIEKAPPRSASITRGDPAEEFVLIISNVIENGSPLGELGDAEAFWHQDMTYRERPPVGALLYALEVPRSGGNTEFCNLYRAYDTLPERVRDRIDNLDCIHDGSFDSAGRPRKGRVPTTDPRRAAGPTHPLVMRHPRTGRKHLYLGRRPFAYIPGLELEASEALLNELWSHCQSRELRWTQEWQLGDLLLWDNRCTMHRRDSFDPRARRVMHRTQLVSDGCV